MDQYTKALLLWKDRGIVTGADLAGALENFRGDFVFHCLKMEGDDALTPELVRQVLEGSGARGSTGGVPSLSDLQGAADAWALLPEAFDSRRPFSGQLLAEIHARLTRQSPAPFSDDAVQTLAQLEELLGHVRRQNTLVAAAYLLAQLEKHPPFARANGSAARFITNYFLVLHDHPPTIFYEEDRRDYRSVIDVSDGQPNLAPLVRFLKEELAKTWDEDIRRDEEYDTVWLEGP